MVREVLTVCLPPLDARALRRAVAEAIAPYDHNADGDDLPPGEWDSWTMGAAGREFWVEPGLEDDPLVTRDYEPVREGKAHVIAPDRCSGGPVRLLGLAGQRSRAAAEADVLWSAWEELSSGFPPARSLDDLIAEHPEATVRHAGPAWQRYADQPLVRAVLDDADLLARFGQQAMGEFGVGRDRYSQRKADDALVRDALLTLDGSWVTSVSQRDDEYISFFNTYVDELAPDTVLVNITYHS